jgi:hypothetical protein
MATNNEDRRPDGIAMHLVAIIAGIGLMLLGVGLSVTMVLLPIGVPLGLTGLAVLVWGATPSSRQ